MHLKQLQPIIVVCGLYSIERMYGENIVENALHPRQGHNIPLPLDENAFV
jgi:hypothetical protein